MVWGTLCVIGVLASAKMSEKVARTEASVPLTLSLAVALCELFKGKWLASTVNRLREGVYVGGVRVCV